MIRLLILMLLYMITCSQTLIDMQSPSHLILQFHKSVIILNKMQSLKSIYKDDFVPALCLVLLPWSLLCPLCTCLSLALLSVFFSISDGQPQGDVTDLLLSLLATVRFFVSLVTTSSSAFFQLQLYSRVGR